MCSRTSNVKRSGVYFVEKASVFIEIRVLFWPEISTLGVYFNFDNKRMRPRKYSSAPLGIYKYIYIYIYI